MATVSGPPAELLLLDTDGLLRRAEVIARQDPVGESDVRWHVVSVLRDRATEEVFRGAEAWTRSPEPHLRALGIDVLAQLGKTAENQGRSPFAAAARPIVLRALGDSHARVIQSAIHATAHLRPDDEDDEDDEDTDDDEDDGHDEADEAEDRALAAFVERPEVLVRRALAFALGGRESEIAIATLMALMDDTDSDVRDWATFGLGSQTDADTPAIREALFGRLTDEDDTVRAEALVGLALRKDPRAKAAALAEIDRRGSDFVRSPLGEEVLSELSDPELTERAARHTKA